MAEIAIRRPTSRAIPKYWLFIDWHRRGWVSRFCEYDDGNWRNISQGAGQPSAFFLYLSTVKAKRGVTVNVVGWQIYEHLCCCDIYQAIHDGLLLLTDGRVVGNNPVSLKTAKKLMGGLVCDNPPTIIDAMTCEGQRLKFLDIANWGIARKDIDDGECPFDCDVPMQAVQDYVALLTTLDMGALKTTAASQGYYCFRLNHLKHTVIADNEECARPIERRSYVAGRAECFRLGKLPGVVFHLDVKSMYTSIGRTMLFPTRLKDVRFNCKPHSITRIANKFGYIAHVELQTNEPAYPLRIDKRVIYPVGQFDAYLCGPEIDYAFINGDVRKVHSLCRYDMAPIFESWAQWYFGALDSLEALGLAHLKGALKLAVNSMYGKIGQRSKLWRDNDDFPPRFPWEQWWGRHPKNGNVVQYRSIDGSVQYLDADQESATSCPAISSYMCSYGRMRLWDILINAGLHNCYYCDTDGIMVNRDGYDRLMAGGYIQAGVYGALQVREVSDDVEIFGIKHYRFGPRWCCSGLPANGVQQTDGRVYYEQHNPFQNGLWHRKAFEHEYTLVSKSYKHDYKHGVKNDDGTVSTFRVGIEETVGENDNVTAIAERQTRILGTTRLFAR